MALLFFFSKLKEKGLIKSVRAIHIHHGTRVSQDEEEKIVRLFCESLRVKLQVFYLHDLKNAKNFENEARTRRYAIFSKARLKEELVALAHHIDDSFEWGLMQNFKSSEVESGLGIPVKREYLIRPFLCVSKKQISFYRKIYELPFVKDPTNDQVQFERNYLRHIVIPEIAKRYPQYLKHYVKRQNKLAFKLGVHLLSLKNEKKEITRVSKEGFILFVNKNDPELLEKIKNHLKKITHVRWRAGKQEEQIRNMLSSHKVGPMHLPGGFELFIHGDALAVLPKNFVFRSKTKLRMDKMSLAEFKKLLTHMLKKNHSLSKYPFFVGATKFDKAVRTYRKHSLWPALDKYQMEHQLKITDAFSLIEWWSQPKHQKKIISLTYLW